MKNIYIMSLLIVAVIGATFGLITQYYNHEEAIMLTGFGLIIIIVMFTIISEKQRSEKNVN